MILEILERKYHGKQWNLYHKYLTLSYKYFCWFLQDTFSRRPWLWKLLDPNYKGLNMLFTFSLAKGCQSLHLWRCVWGNISPQGNTVTCTFAPGHPVVITQWYSTSQMCPVQENKYKIKISSITKPVLSSRGVFHKLVKVNEIWKA